ncbi:hypothetical protein ACC686_35955, partial [Rhizobium johnstonii]
VHVLLDRAPIFSPSVGKFAQGMILQVPLHLYDLSEGTTMESIHAALVAHCAEDEEINRVLAFKLDGIDAGKGLAFGQRHDTDDILAGIMG